MRLIGKSPKQDPAKATIHDLDEFRGRRISGKKRGSTDRARMPLRYAVALGVIAGLASYVWTNHYPSSPAARAPIYPATVAPFTAPLQQQAPTSIAPSPSAVIAQSSDVLEVRASSNGYMTAGSVNGVPVSFMVDTGASHISLPAALAQQAGIRCEKQGQSSTANGIVSACAGTASEVTFGPFRLTNVSVTMMPNAQNALLGMDALRRFTMTWHGDTVRIAVPGK